MTGRPPPATLFRARRRPEVALVFAVALVARLLVPVLSSGGLHGLYDYDPSVYYAAADGLVSGKLPYRDFYLVHPPLLPLALTPFAELGRLTTDHIGFVAACLASTVLGAVNATLVCVLGRRLGLRPRAATVAGLFYAVWFGSVDAEFTCRLEPLGNALFLLGLLTLVRSRRTSSAGTAVAAGVLLGLMMTVKIWWALPFVLVLAESAVGRRPRELARVAVGAVAAVVVVCGPFAVAAGGRMWQMMIEAQLGRPRVNGTFENRTLLGTLVLPPSWTGNGHTVTGAVVATVLAVLTVVVVTVAWRVRAARVAVVLLGVQILAWYAEPSVFSFYADWFAVPAAITVGAAVHSLASAPSRSRRRAADVLVGALALATMVVTTVDLSRVGSQLIAPFGPTGHLVTAARRYGCMTSGSPMLLIEADALSSSFRPGCHDLVDVISPRLGVGVPGLAQVAGRPDPQLSRWVRSYLTSGSVTLPGRLLGVHMDPDDLRAIYCGRIVARAGNAALHRIQACSTR